MTPMVIFKRAPRRSERPTGGEGKEFTVDELAWAAETTVRNVRAYQDRGLLEPPERRGRVGIYAEHHLARLRLINHLLARGYTLNNIQDLLDAIVDGRDLRAILGLESAISSPWSDVSAQHYSDLKVARMFGTSASRAGLERAIGLGLLEPAGGGYLCRNPRLLTLGAELIQAGLALDELLDIVEASRGHFQAISDTIVARIAKRLDVYGNGQLPPQEEIPGLTEKLWKMRPLAMALVEAEMRAALERSAAKFLGDRVAQILERIEKPTAGPPPAVES